mmetsp:Transcript_19061/g.38508  ORF Transcript_19061/g.38508 Transcript_19061/m.38508 type:complete len:241 (+) Transcript_19061:87-809(+)
MSKKGGFTEAELMAAAWSKQQRLLSGQQQQSNAPDGSHRSNIISKNHQHSMGNRDQNLRNRSNDGLDQNFRKSRIDTSDRRDRRPRSRSKSKTDSHPSPVDTTSRSNVEVTRDAPSVDGFGRTIEPGMKVSRICRSRSRSRSHRRSETHSKQRFRSPSRSRSRSPSRSRSRSRSRNSGNNWKRGKSSAWSKNWTHDKFDRNASPERDPRESSRIPQDYRPPSPTWVSKAGGIAIMRKKLD